MVQIKYFMVKDKGMVKVMNIKVVIQQNVINKSCQKWSKAGLRNPENHGSDQVLHGRGQGHG